MLLPEWTCMEASKLFTHGPTMRELTPVGPGKAERAEEQARKRERQQYAAATFLVEGKAGDEPPHGKEWSREYNPRPYPEAVPSADVYAGTGIGFLYGFWDEKNGSPVAWQMAGWQLVRTGAEVRSRRPR